MKPVYVDLRCSTSLHGCDLGRRSFLPVYGTSRPRRTDHSLSNDWGGFVYGSPMERLGLLQCVHGSSLQSRTRGVSETTCITGGRTRG